MISILQLTDLHISRRPGEALRGVDTRASLAAVLEHAAVHTPHAPDALLLTGDIADDGSAEAYEYVGRSFAGWSCPILCVPGNHDEPATLRRVLGAAGFYCEGSLRLGDWTIELLDSHAPGEVSGRLTPASVRQLTAPREEAGYRLLALHHPPVALGSRWLDACALQDPQALLASVDADARVRAVVWGHAHQAFEGRRGRARLLGTPSTCRQFLPGSDDFAVDDARGPAYRWLGLHDDGRVDTEVAWLDPRAVSAGRATSAGGTR